VQKSLNKLIQLKPTPMLPDLHLLSTKNVKMLIAVQRREFIEAKDAKVSDHELRNLELTLEQLCVELKCRT
jgi:hypothetical protein